MANVLATVILQHDPSLAQTGVHCKRISGKDANPLVDNRLVLISRWVFLLVSFLGVAVPSIAQWTTFNHDPQRTGWASEETKLTQQSVPDLDLKWSVHVENTSLALDALTAPVVARGVVTESGTRSVVYVAGSSNHIFAMDVTTGAMVWQRTFPTYVNAKDDSFFLCPNAINATPVIDRKQNEIFVLALDGRLYGLDLGSGAIRFGPAQLVPPMAKAWSLNLQNGFVFTTTSQFCGGDPAGVYSVRVDSGRQRVSYETVIRGGSGAGLWNRGGTAISGDGTVYVSSGDGPFDPGAGEFGSTFLAFHSPTLEIADYFSPMDWTELNTKDLDLPSGGLALFEYRDHNLLVGGGKDARVYLLNADALGSKDHVTPLFISERMGNDQRTLEAKGFWGSPAVWRDEAGEVWVFEPLWGEPSAAARALGGSNGPAPNGAIVALRTESDANGQVRLKPMWISGDVNLPDAPVVANGVVFVVGTGENPKQVHEMRTEFKSQQDWKQNLLTTEERGNGTHPQTLFALDAKTGKVLYRNNSSMKSWNHFGGLAIDDGRIFAVDHGSNVYCFGLKSR